MAHKAATEKSAPKTLKALQEELQKAELEYSIAEIRWASQTLSNITVRETAGDLNVPVKEDPDASRWELVASGSSIVYSKDVPQLRNLQLSRRESYRAWRLDPHARGILRNFVKFIIGREFKYDPADIQRGEWDVARETVKLSQDPAKPLATRLIWDEFARENKFNARAKELILRTFRDGEVFVRKFENAGRVSIRFIEPDRINSNATAGQTTVTIAGVDRTAATVIRSGIEVLADDVETVVAYHVMSATGKSVAVPAAEVLHVKCMADANDPRGFPFLEPVLKSLTNYNQWEEYRLVLNKVRTAVALVRKVEGTQVQAQGIIGNRQGARSIEGREMQTGSGNRETMLRPGTILTPGPGVTYEYTAPRLEARDAGEDGRRILLSVASGTGLPEMMITGSWENANFASTSEAISISMREWEDWQDFFEPVFKTIWLWVIQAALTGNRLPASINPEVSINWPPVSKRDAIKETARNKMLHEAGILSKKTWSGREALVFDDELENLEQEAELNPEPIPVVPEGEQSESWLPDHETRARRLHLALVALGDLEESIDKHPAPEAQAALRQYVEAARDVLLVQEDASRKGMQIQTLIFDKSKFDRAQAVNWAKSHGFKSSKVDETDGAFRLRQQPPDKFNTLRTIRLTAGVQAVVGK